MVLGHGLGASQAALEEQDALGERDYHVAKGMELAGDFRVSEDLDLLTHVSVEVQEELMYNPQASDIYQTAKVKMQRELCRKLGLPADMGKSVDLEGHADSDHKIRWFFKSGLGADTDHVAQSANLFRKRFSTLHGLIIGRLKDQPEELDSYLTDVIGARDEMNDRSRIIGSVLIAGEIHTELPCITEIEPVAADALVECGLPRSVVELCDLRWSSIQKLLTLLSAIEAKPSQSESPAVQANITQYMQRIIDRVGWELNTTRGDEKEAGIQAEIDELDARRQVLISLLQRPR